MYILPAAPLGTPRHHRSDVTYPCISPERGWPRRAEPKSWRFCVLVAIVELLPGVLDAQLRRASQLTHCEYLVLAMLSEAPERVVRMSALAQRTNATLPRLSHVVRRLEERGLVERRPAQTTGGPRRAPDNGGVGHGGGSGSRLRRHRPTPGPGP